MIDYYEPKLDLTLLGCGFLGPFHLGAICLLEQIWPSKPYNRICGSSCGGLVGALLTSGLKLDYVIELALGMLRQFRIYFERLFSPNTWSKVGNRTRQKSSSLRGTARDCEVDYGGDGGNDPGYRVTRFGSDQARAVYNAPLLDQRQEQKSAFICWRPPMLPIGQIVEHTLSQMLPEDAHLKCSNRLGLSVTRMSWSFENKFVSDFHSRQDLIQAICAGCFIPIWSGSWRGPRFRDQHYMDGAYSDNEPKFELTPDDRLPVAKETMMDLRSKCKLDEERESNDTTCSRLPNSGLNLGQTIRQVGLSPFACEVEIAPKDQNTIVLFRWPISATYYKCNWSNIVRCAHAMLPHRLPVYRQYLISGFEEMKNYLLDNDLLKCESCYNELKERRNHYYSYLSENDGGAKSADDTFTTNNKPACLFCLRLFERVDSLKVSDDILRLFQD